MKTPAFFKVEPNIPLPDPNSGRSRGPVMVAMSQLKHGDSFLVPILTSNETIRAAATRLGIKIATRKLADGRRIWRTK